MIKKKIFTSTNGQREIHAIIRPQKNATFQEQLKSVYDDIKNIEIQSEMTAIMVRYFLSDPANQASEVNNLTHKCAVSMVGQAPLGGEKVAAWVWLQEGVELDFPRRDFHIVKHGCHTTLIQTSACMPGLSSNEATRAILANLAEQLKAENATLLNNCLRTWLFVRDVDVNYAGVVNGRNEVFANNGLTSATHFIASTGINGVHENPKVQVSIDSLNYIGIEPEQIKQLKAESHMNPTSEYGVAFERGTSIDFGDRRHVYISGTASINNRGEVEHIGNIKRQTERMIENVGALLTKAECNFSDVGHIIVYLRDIADQSEVESLFSSRFPQLPYILVHAPVCRPAWLIEMECMAFKPIKRNYAAF